MNLSVQRTVLSFIAIGAVSLVIVGQLTHAFKLIQPWSDEKPACSNNNHKLLSLFNLLCNATQTTSIATRDACYGCFFRAGVLPAGQTQLTAVSQCATIYLMNSNYALCATSLAVSFQFATKVSRVVSKLEDYIFCLSIFRRPIFKQRSKHTFNINIFFLFLKK